MSHPDFPDGHYIEAFIESWWDVKACRKQYTDEEEIQGARLRSIKSRGKVEVTAMP